MADTVSFDDSQLVTSDVEAEASDAGRVNDAEPVLLVLLDVDYRPGSRRTTNIAASIVNCGMLVILHPFEAG